MIPMSLSKNLFGSNLSSFKHKLNLKNDVELNIQHITDNIIFAKGKEYHLDQSTKVPIFKSGASYAVNGIYQESTPQTNIHSINYNDEETVIIRKNFLDEIQAVSIHSKKSKKITDLISIGKDEFITVEDEDIDVENLDILFDDDDYDPTENRLFENGLVEIKETEWVASECDGEYHVIDLAVTYDSAYCDAFNGNEEEANESIFELIARVSEMYQQKGLCTVINISHLESFCDESLDPFKPYLQESDDLTCSSFGGFLDIFSEWFQENRDDVDRHVSHIFTGSRLGCKDSGACVLGCADFAGACSDYFGFGATDLLFSENPLIRLQTVAHEIGHNLAALHDLEEIGLMSPSYTNKEVGFSSGSIQQMLSYFNRTDCIEQIPFDLPPPLPPLGEDGDCGESNLGKSFGQLVSMLSNGVKSNFNSI